MFNRLLAVLAFIFLLPAAAIAQEISVPGGNFATPATVNLDMSGFDVLKLGSLKFGSSSDAILTRDAANVVAQRNGANAQGLKVYNTFTDASNYETGLFDWTVSSNTLTIGTTKAGTGSTRSMTFYIGGSTAWTIDTSSNLKPTGNGYVSTNFHTVSGLATCNAAAKGARDMVTDGSVAASGNFGGTITGGGSNVNPVYCDGTNWRYG